MSIDGPRYWFGLPFRWAYQMVHNGHGIVRVLDITRFRPLPHGLISPEHPWATGINPLSGRPIWNDNVIFRSPRGAEAEDLPDDDTAVTKTGQFLAQRVSLSTGPEEIPVGPRRRMPHAINYIHGTSHYNSGILVFTDFADALTYFSDHRFRKELHRFVRIEKREILSIFRQREYRERDYAHFSGAMRTLFPWFCNPNGPKQKVLWGNHGPFPAANLITGAWVRDVYALKRPDGAAAVVRPPIERSRYFQGEYGGGRPYARWPERLLARVTYWRIRLRGGKGGMFFVDRRDVYADQIERQKRLGIADQPVARI